MKIKSWLKEKMWVVFFSLTIITSIALGYIATVEKVLPFQTYNGLEVATIEDLSKEPDVVKRRKIIDKTDEIGKTKLQNGDIIVQRLALTTNIIDKITLDIDVYEKSELLINVINEKRENVYSKSVNVDKTDQQVVIPLNGLIHERMDSFNVEITVVSDAPEKSIAIYNCDYSDGTFFVNNKSVEKVLLTNIEGTLIVYKEKSLLVLAAMTIIFMIIAISSYIHKGKHNKGLHNVLDFILAARWRMYGLEIIGYILVAILGLKFYTSYTYQADLDILAMYLFVTLAILWGALVYQMIRKYRHSIADVFVILAIPIGLSFIFIMLPDQVPDEQTHFAKAYLTSTFDFSNSVEVRISSDYGPLKLRNYNDILPAIFASGKYSNTILYDHACPYNFLLYILPGMGIFICRILGLSIYFAYYVGRIINLLMFIYIGYRCIKAVPVAKYLFLVYLFNPMVLQQAASYSGDAMVNSLMLVVVTYFLWLFHRKELLTNKQIITVFGLLALVAIWKYAYLPVFGIYLLLYKKIFKMDKAQIILFVSCLVGVVVTYILMAKFTGPAGNMAGMDNYLVAKKVNSGEQIKYMITHPMDAFRMLKQTLQMNQSFYVQSFVGMFSWLSIKLNKIATILYVLIMFVSPLLIEDKLKFKNTQKIWIAIIGILNILLIIVAMYITWTPVGQGFAEGVQGRYFIPLVILILIAYSGSKKILIKRPLRFCSIILIIVNLIALNDIMNYFIFLV